MRLGHGDTYRSHATRATACATARPSHPPWLCSPIGEAGDGDGAEATGRVVAGDRPRCAGVELQRTEIGDAGAEAGQRPRTGGRCQFQDAAAAIDVACEDRAGIGDWPVCISGRELHSIAAAGDGAGIHPGHGGVRDENPIKPGDRAAALVGDAAGGEEVDACVVRGVPRDGAGIDHSQARLRHRQPTGQQPGRGDGRWIFGVHVEVDGMALEPISPKSAGKATCSAQVPVVSYNKMSFD